ncbi:MAG: hypothetical protein HOP15_04990, partial [Planctomycetes bacterium]|nr:hypothetical protein [Planctomycetota bacterium]
MFFRVALALLAVLQDGAKQPDLELSPFHFPARVGGAASAFPSWLVADGSPALVATHFGEEDPFLELCWIEGATGHAGTLVTGQGWFLNWADFPAVAGLADGTRLVAWLELEPAHPHSYGTRFSILAPTWVNGDSMESRSLPRPLEEHRGPGEHGFVSLAPLDETRFLTLWLDGRAAADHDGDTRVYARTIDRAGVLGAETLVDARACSCCPTALVRLANGTHLAAWRDRSEEEVRDIALARFDGGHWSESELLHADGWEIDGCPVNGPRLAASPACVAATWYTGADGSVRVSFGDSRVRGFGAPIRVDDGSPEGRGDLAFLPDEQGPVAARGARVQSTP